MKGKARQRKMAARFGLKPSDLFLRQWMLNHGSISSRHPQVKMWVVPEIADTRAPTVAELNAGMPIERYLSR